MKNALIVTLFLLALMGVNAQRVQPLGIVPGTFRISSDDAATSLISYCKVHDLASPSDFGVVDFKNVLEGNAFLKVKYNGNSYKLNEAIDEKIIKIPTSETYRSIKIERGEVAKTGEIIVEIENEVVLGDVAKGSYDFNAYPYENIDFNQFGYAQHFRESEELLEIFQRSYVWKRESSKWISNDDFYKFYRRIKDDLGCQISLNQVCLSNDNLPEVEFQVSCFDDFNFTLSTEGEVTFSSEIDGNTYLSREFSTSISEAATNCEETFSQFCVSRDNLTLSGDCMEISVGRNVELSVSNNNRTIKTKF